MSRPARGVVLAAAGVILLAAALRVAVGSLSPVIAQISADIALPSWVIGVIGAAPPVSFAVLGFVTPVLARRFSLEALAVAALAVSAVALVVRAFAPDALVLVLATLAAFAGVGVGNVILPGLIKKHFPASIGTMTTVYVSTMGVATLVPSALAVPIADAAGWRLSLGIWAVVGVAAIVPWFVMLLRARTESLADGLEAPDPAVLGRLLRLPLTWALIAAMTVSATTVYAMFAWLPLILQERAGVGAAAAGAMLGVFGGMGIPFGLILPFVVARLRLVRTVFVIAVVPGMAGALGMLWAPASAPWLWVILISFPTMLFPVVLVLVGLRTRTHASTVALSGAVQSIGYAIAAVFPIAFGALHEMWHGWEAPLWILVALFAVGIPAGLVIARHGSVEDAWERRYGRPW